MLASLAHETGGVYYNKLSTAASGEGEVKPLAETIGSR